MARATVIILPSEIATAMKAEIAEAGPEIETSTTLAEILRLLGSFLNVEFKVDGDPDEV